MAIELLDGLYPLFSDMEINDVDPRDQLKVPTPRPRRRRKKGSSSRTSRHYQNYRSIQHRANQHCASIDASSPRTGLGFPVSSRISRHKSKSSSLDTLFPLTPNSMLIAPNVTIHEGEASHSTESAGDFVLNFSKNLTDTNRAVRGQSGSESPKASSCRIPITRVNSNSSAFKFQFKKRGRARAMTDPQPTSSSSTTNCSRPSHSKRRIRTFYSKKWGNKLFGLTSQTSPSPMSAPVTSRVTPCKPPPFPLNPTHIDIAATVDAVCERERCHERDATAQSLISLSGMELWRSSLCSMRSPSPSPVHVGGVSSVEIEIDGEEDIQVDVDANVDCSQNLNAAHLGVATDFRFAENGTYAYDSATSMVSMVSMLAANTDADDEGGDDDDNDDDDEAEMVQMVESVENCKRRSAFKIVVSEPMEHHHFEGGHQSEEEQRARNVFNSRMTSKRNKRRLCKRYIASDYDDSDCGGSSADCSSSDDCVTDDECVREHPPMMRAHGHSEQGQGQQGQGLYLCGNDLNVGVYSSFCFENDRESDLLSEISGQSDSDYGDVSDGAQSDDSAFDELTICYGRGRNFRNAKNIRFRGDLGPSDIGSSDTECCYGSSDTEQPLSAGQ